jgi:hypothetical protein
MRTNEDEKPEDQQEENLGLPPEGDYDWLDEYDDVQPSEKSETQKSLLTRPRILRRTTPAILRAFREKVEATIRRLFGMALADVGYPIDKRGKPSGGYKALGDALGHNSNGARLHRSKGGEVIRCRENAVLLLRLFRDDRAAIATEAGFVDEVALKAFVDSLPTRK